MSNYYRCAFIVRGRGQQLTDELLPLFSQMVMEITPCEEIQFNVLARRKIGSIVPGGGTTKTIDNYRTEIIGKILGLYYVNYKGIVHISNRAKKLIETQDHIQFFKDLCCRLQAPSAISKKARTFVLDGISFWPASSLIKILRTARDDFDIEYLTKKEVNYHIFSSKDVLTSSVSSYDVARRIHNYRIGRRNLPISGGSREAQHSNEVLNLMANANLIHVSGNHVRVNEFEADDINKIIDYQNTNNLFDCSSYDLTSSGGWKKFETDWDQHYAELCFPADSDAFLTKKEKWDALIPLDSVENESIESIRVNESITALDPVTTSTKEIGDEGEEYIYINEKRRVKVRLPDEISRVLRLGSIRGLGYDVQSVLADGSNRQHEFIYIEVKSSIRATRPTGKHVVTLTSNEYRAALQHRDSFYVYKVYLIGESGSSKVLVFSLKNPLDDSEGISINRYEDKYIISFDSNVSNEVAYE